MYYLFSDDEHSNIALESKTIKKALKEAKDRFSIKGKLKLITHCGYDKVYKLISSDYRFTLTIVF